MHQNFSSGKGYSWQDLFQQETGHCQVESYWASQYDLFYNSTTMFLSEDYLEVGLIFCVCMFMFIYSDGSLQCKSSNWYIRVFRHQQLHFCDPGGRKRREWTHPAGQPWIGLLSRSSKCLWNSNMIIYDM